MPLVWRRKLKIRRLAYFIIIIAVTAFLAGCGESSKTKAREFNEQANAHIEKAGELNDAAAEIGKDIDKLPTDIEGNKEAIKLGEEQKDNYEKIEKEYKEALKFYKRGKNLDLPKNSKKYFELETDATSAAIDKNKSLIKITDQLIMLTEKIVDGTLTEEEFSSFEENFMKLNEEFAKEEAKYNAADKTANEFFEEKEIKKELEEE